MTDLAIEKLIADIEEAFAKAEYPGDENITAREHCGECEEIADAFKGKEWQSLRDVKFLRYHEAALSLFKPTAFRYYLPAFMRAALSDPRMADIVIDGVVFHLTPPLEIDNPEYDKRERDYFLGKVMGFTNQQANVIKAYLELDARLYVLGSFEDEVAERKRAFEFWKNYKG